MKEALAYLAIAVLMLFVLASLAKAETYQQGKVKIVFKNKCPDLVADDWSCLNRTQAAQTAETIEQVLEAVKNTKYKGRLTIHSIDPKRPSRGVWEFGAWKKGSKIAFAAMPGCPNAREELEQILRSK
jgi:hypothetical protein